MTNDYPMLTSVVIFRPSRRAVWHYEVRVERDDNGTWLLTVPDLPEVTTFAERQSQIEARAIDAIEEALEARGDL